MLASTIKCTYIDSYRAIVCINYSLVTRVNRQMQIDIISNVYFDVERILSKWMRHQIIKLSPMTFISKGTFALTGGMAWHDGYLTLV